MIIKEPSVRDKITLTEPLKYKAISRHVLRGYNDLNLNDFTQLIEGRRSRRDFTCISLDDLGPLFYLTSRTKETAINENGLVVEKRNVPSSGGLHTINCFVSKLNDGSWYVYNSHQHSLDKIRVKSPSKLAIFKGKCQNLIGCSGDPYLIWYVCDLTRLGSKYENPESLALREAGAIASIQSLVAEGLNLAFCMLGLTGGNEASALLDQRQLLGVGAVIVGGRTRST